MLVHSLEVSIAQPSPSGERELLALLDVECGGLEFGHVELRLELLDDNDGLLRLIDSWVVGSAQPGRQLVHARCPVRLVSPAARVRWEVCVRHREWRGPVRALASSASDVPALDAAVTPPASTPNQQDFTTEIRRPQARTSVPLPRVDSPPPPPSPPPETRWTRAAAGDTAVVADEFEGTVLDMDGRDRVRELMRGPEPTLIAIACRICAVTGWRTAAQNMRRLLGHESAEVREAAAEAIGMLAGPAMEHYLKPLVQDPNKQVRAAALTAITRIGKL